ncbi:Succinate dehydrogenase, hydrophobic membrane anchor protein [Luteimonas sp. 9C]|uniref:succinate dehydrogenase, hydrophobic membrane anchor protein n=1 Tax=Luteimonas sp. 9C TaxID=2653148 RepID=UPI0012F2E051|nr:succinate dehydrogenase, hydrophobic membrane anchor protein [Luteimonas sp. 9C]VXB35714.1 Succinate dehydrogenase, hydrophobic membrane anchor protein [Luteimonas sp. 9C]
MSESKTPVEVVRQRDFRTPVGRARGLGSGKTGTGHFWWQRVTAVALVPLVAWFIGTLVSLAGADLVTVQTVIARPFNAIAFGLFAIVMFWHAKLGLQVVIEDYIHQRALEVSLQLLVTFACAAGALASLYAIARIALLG